MNMQAVNEFYKTAWTAAQDEGNRHARACGRNIWSPEDCEYAASVLEVLILQCELCGEPAGEGGALCPACQESR